MEQIFVDDAVNLDAFAEPVRPLLAELLGVRLATRAAELGTTHLVLAVARAQPEPFATLIEPLLPPGRRPEEIREALQTWLHEEDNPPPTPGPLLRELLTDGMIEALEDVRRELPPDRPAPSPLESAHAVLRLAFLHLSSPDKVFLSRILPIDRFPTSPPGAEELAAAEGGSVFREDGTLDPEATTADGRQLLEDTLRFASRSGQQAAYPSHLALAGLDCRNPRIHDTIGVYGKGSRRTLARNALFSRVDQGTRAEPLAAARASFAGPLELVIERAGRFGRPIGAAALFLSLLENLDLDPITSHEIRRGPLLLDVEPAIAFLVRSLREDPSEDPPVSTRLPRFLSEFEDLTAELRAAPKDRYVERPEAEEVVRALYSRSQRCVVVHGEPGVGRTSLVESVVRAAAAGEEAFLRETLFVRLDAMALTPEARRSFFAVARSSLDGGAETVLVIEGLHLLLGDTADSFLRLLDGQRPVRVLGVVRTEEYGAMLAEHPDLKGRVWGVDLPPPDREVSLRILESVCPALEREFELTIDRGSLTDILGMADDFVPDRAQPGGSVDLLRLGCEEAAFVRARGATETPVVRAALAAQALAAQGGHSVDEILGGRTTGYYRRELSRSVLGQPEAVAAAAECLAAARGGVRGPELPAGILLFVGQTGTGKTLLAREMGRLYSPSGQVHTFRLGEYTEAHSTARLVGAPPGYVGHDRGGGIVEALRAEPVCVLVFDEAEKAHPEVLKLLLHLCDSSRIEDSARRVGHTTSAIIVLTSNLCQDVIDSSPIGRLPHEEVTAVVREAIRDARRPRTGTPYFPPELLGRLGDPVIFRPLTPEALLAISQREIDLLVTQGLRQRSIRLTPGDDGTWEPLARHLTEICAGDKKHGRAVQQALKRLVAVPLSGFTPGGGEAATIRVELEGEPGVGQVRVKDHQGRLIGGSE